MTSKLLHAKDGCQDHYKQGVISDNLVVCMQGLITKQFALLHVHSYPNLIQLDAMIERLAQQHNKHYQQQVLASTHPVDTRHDKPMTLLCACRS